MSSETRDGEICNNCGTFGDLPHTWTEGTCILPHRYDKPPGQHPPRASTGLVCGHCIDRHRSQLTEIVELYAHLDDVLNSPAVQDDTGEYKRPHKRPASPAPIRLEAWSMLHDTARLNAHGPQRDDRTFSPDYIHTATPDVVAVLSSWVGWLYESLGWATDVPGSVSGLCNALTTHADDIPTLGAAGQIGEYIDDYDAELRWLRTALRRAHGLSDPTPIADCLNNPRGGECGGHVWRTDDGKGPRCDKCGRRYKGADAIRLGVHARRQKQKAKTA